MVLHELLNISEVKSLKLPRRGQDEKVEIRTVMLLVSIVNNKIGLTDFTSPLDGQDVLWFNVRPYSQVSSQVDQLTRYYPSVKKTGNSLLYLENSQYVFLNISANAYNSTTDFVYELVQFKILNIEPFRSIIHLTPGHIAKITGILEQLHKRKILGECKNEKEISNIEKAIKRTKSNQKIGAHEKAPVKVLADTELKSDEVNPLFAPPVSGVEDSHGAIYTQTQIEDSNGVIYTQTQIEDSIGLQEGSSSSSTAKSSTQRWKNWNDSQEETPSIHSDSAKKPTPEILSSDTQQEQDVTQDEDAIETIMNTTDFELGKVITFRGYVIGVEPFDTCIIGKAFNDLIKTTNFRLLISNNKKSALKIFKVNKNCLSLDFRSKEKILEFFGINNNFDEETMNNSNLIREKLLNLLENQSQLSFEIARKVINLSNGKLLVWECQNRIDDLLL